MNGAKLFYLTGFKTRMLTLLSLKHCLLSLFFIVFLLTSCQRDKTDAKISEINIEINFKRFDLELNSLNSENLTERIPVLEKEYGDFFEIFNNRIINIGSISEKNYAYNLNTFLSDPVMTEARNDVSKTFEDISESENQITQAFRRFHYFFTKKKIPNLVFFFGGFNQSIVTADNIIGIGLEKYLGAKSKYYSMLNVPKYMRRKMEPEQIPFDALYGWSKSEFAPPENANVLAQIIYEGKLMFLQNCFFPETADSIIFSYSSSDWQWVEASEKEMWKFLIEKQLLFSSDAKHIMRLTGDGPFTAFFSEDSPAKAGIWIGWRIVCRFIENNPKITPAQLMENQDFQSILSLSAYNP